MSLRVPAGDGPHPLVIYIHGGGWLFGHPHSMHVNLAAMDIDAALLGAGFAVARVSYRLSSEGTFPTQLQDCKSAVRYLRHHADLFGLDPERFASLGESAGGHLAILLGLATPAEFEGDVGVCGPSSQVNAVVDWYGITNLQTLVEQALPDSFVRHDTAISAPAQLIGGTIAQCPEAARAASPVTWVNQAAAPCLIMHGTMDRVVPAAQGAELYEAMKTANAVARWEPLEGADHCFTGYDTRHIMDSVIAFLQTALPDPRDKQ
nr:alpha/beta hydrolase [Devosia subaequoris]